MYQQVNLKNGLKNMFSFPHLLTSFIIYLGNNVTILQLQR